MAYTPPAIKYAGHAVMHGFTLHYDEMADTLEDAPTKFTLRDIDVFETAIGWRVAKRDPDTDTYIPANGMEDFVGTLRKALRIAIERARPLTEADRNPMMPHVRALLRMFQGGTAREVGNPYCNPTIRAALEALKEQTGHKGSWMDVNGL